MGKKMDAKLFDHTILKADADREAVKKVCSEAKEYGFMSVCVNGFYTSYVLNSAQGTYRISFNSQIAFTVVSAQER